MDDTGRMRGCQRVGDLRRQTKSALDGQRSGGDDLGERAAFDVLRGDVVQALVGVDVVDRQNVRMVER